MKTIKSKILKYTSVELINELIKKENLNTNEEEKIKRVANKYNLNEELFIELLKFPKVLSYEMYEILSRVLGKSIRELTEIEDVELKPDYRAAYIGKESDEINEFLIFANNIFDEIISVRKLRKINE